MKQIELSLINVNQIGYADGYVKYEPGLGITSNVYKRMRKLGCTVGKQNNYFVMKDTDKRIVTQGETWLDMLVNLSKVMR